MGDTNSSTRKSNKQRTDDRAEEEDSSWSLNRTNSDIRPTAMTSSSGGETAELPTTAAEDEDSFATVPTGDIDYTRLLDSEQEDEKDDVVTYTDAERLPVVAAPITDDDGGVSSCGERDVEQKLLRMLDEDDEKQLQRLGLGDSFPSSTQPGKRMDTDKSVSVETAIGRGLASGGLVASARKNYQRSDAADVVSSDGEEGGAGSWSMAGSLKASWSMAGSLKASSASSRRTSLSSTDGQYDDDRLEEDEDEPLSEASLPTTQLATGHGENDTERKNDITPCLFTNALRGVITMQVRKDLIVEIAADQSFRVALLNQFAASCNGKQSTIAINHPLGRVVQRREKLLAYFENGCAVCTGPNGVLTSIHGVGKDAYLLSSRFTPLGAVTAIAKSQLKYPSIESGGGDVSITAVFSTALERRMTERKANSIVRQATYRDRPTLGGLPTDGSGWSAEVHKVRMRWDAAESTLTTSCGANFVRMNANDGYLAVRNDSCYVCFEGSGEEATISASRSKQIHVNRSSVVVTDGNRSLGLRFNGQLFTFD